MDQLRAELTSTDIHPIIPKLLINHVMFNYSYFCFNLIFDREEIIRCGQFKSVCSKKLRILIGGNKILFYGNTYHFISWPINEFDWGNVECAGSKISDISNWLSTDFLAKVILGDEFNKRLGVETAATLRLILDPWESELPIASTSFFTAAMVSILIKVNYTVINIYQGLFESITWRHPTSIEFSS